MFLLIIGALVAFMFIIMIVAGNVTDDLESKMADDPRVQAEVTKRIAPVGQVAVKAKPKPAPKAAAAPAPEAAPQPAPAAEPAPGEPAQAEAEPAAEPEPAAESSLPEPVAAVAGAASDMVDSMVGAAKDAASDVSEAVMPASGPDLAEGKQVYDSACFVCHGTGAAGAPKLGDKAAWAPRIVQGMDVLYTTALNGKGAMPAKGGRMDLSDDAVKAAAAYMVEQAK